MFLVLNKLKKSSLGRWIDIFLLSILMFVAVLIFQNSIVRYLNDWTLYLGQVGPFLQSLIEVVSVAIISFMMIRLGGLHFNHRLKTIFKYPSIWVSPLITFFLLCAFLKLDNDHRLVFDLQSSYLSWLRTFSMVILGLGISFLYEELEVLRSSPTKKIATIGSSATQGSVFEDDAALVAWIMDESPITNPAQDVFDHAIPAKRIARLLLKDSPSSIGVVGPYGCGKSSTLNLVEYYLNNKFALTSEVFGNSTTFHGQYIVCRVGCWGRSNGSIAQKILSLAIEKVRVHVDCMSIVTLPENYRNAIAGTKTAFGAVFSTLLNISTDPVAQLAKLDHILKASGFRLVIFLEDLDRNIGDKIVMEEIPALLDRLRALGQVSFVLAVGTEQRYSDSIIRICDHVEAAA